MSTSSDWVSLYRTLLPAVVYGLGMLTTYCLMRSRNSAAAQSVAAAEKRRFDAELAEKEQRIDR